MEERDIIIAAYIEEDIQSLDLKEGDILFYKDGAYVIETKEIIQGTEYESESTTTLTVESDLIEALAKTELVTKLEIDLNDEI